MKKELLIVFLVGILTACAPAVMPTSTETIHPTITLPSAPVPTATLIPVTETPSLVPTDPISPMITPDPIQVERWKEYENALGEEILNEEISVLCEWEILGKNKQEVYVWAVCNGVSVPAVIYLDTSGGIQKVDVPGMNSDWGTDILKMFPSDVREKFQYRNESVSNMLAHIEWRRSHSDEPPLIVLSATSTP